MSSDTQTSKTMISRYKKNANNGTTTNKQPSRLGLERQTHLFCSCRKRRRRSLCSSALYLLLYWASRGCGAAVLLGWRDTAKLAERASVSCSMGAQPLEHTGTIQVRSLLAALVIGS